MREYRVLCGQREEELGLLPCQQRRRAAEFVAEANKLDKNRIKGKQAYKARLQSERLEWWKEIPLHGQFLRQTEEVRTEDSWMFLRRGELKRETERLLIADQDHALVTKLR
mgnify:CR=1 FL=1